VGGVWLLAGLLFGAWKTRGFRGTLIDFDIPSDPPPASPAGPASPAPR
jgi:hypothetical protein